MQVAACERQNRGRGGRRIANYGSSFEARKATVMCNEAINETYTCVCACDPQCGWKCANEFWNFTERIEELREGRFTGQCCQRAKSCPWIQLPTYFSPGGYSATELLHPGVKNFFASTAILLMGTLLAT